MYWSSANASKQLCDASPRAVAALCISASLKWGPENCSTITAQSGQLAVNEDRKLILHPNFIQHPPPSACGCYPYPKNVIRLTNWRKNNTFWGSWLMFGITRHTSIMKWELKLYSKSSTHCLALGWFLTNVTERREVASQGEVWAASVKGTFQWHSCL